MITIKKNHSQDIDKRLQKQFSSVVRFAFSRRKKDGVTKASELEKIVKNKMKGIDALDASWIKAAVKKSLELDADKKIIFGGKVEFFKRKFGKKNSFDRSIPIDMRGSSIDRGNRKASLDIENSLLIFKPKNGTKIEIPLHLSKNERKMLSELQENCKKKAGFFNLKINASNVWLSFDETKLESFKRQFSFVKGRVLALDMNPNCIGVSICDFRNKTSIIHKEVISLFKLNECSTNKRKHELLELQKIIISLARQFHVQTVAFEILSMKSKNHGIGKNYNKLLNSWNRNIIQNSLRKHLALQGIPLVEVRAEYSSFMGAMKFSQEFDPIAASMEIGFRCHLKERGLNEYDSIKEKCSGLVPTRWKNMVQDDNWTFIDLYRSIKEKKLKDSYRFLFKPDEATAKFGWSCLRSKSCKSMVDLYMV